MYAYWHSSQVNVAGGLNFSGWINPQADAALQAALLTPSRMQRRQEYAAFQKAFYEDAPSVVLYSPLYTYATRAPAQGVTLPPSDMLTPAARFDTMQWWTLDDRR